MIRRLYIDGNQESIKALNELAPDGIAFKVVDIRNFKTKPFSKIPALVTEKGEYIGLAKIREYKAMIETSRWESKKGK